MKKFIAFLVVLSIVFSFGAFSVSADTPVNIVANGNTVSFSIKPFIRDGVAFADIKTLCSKLSLTYKTYSGHDSAIISSYNTALCINPNEILATQARLRNTADEDFEFTRLTAAPFYVGSTLFVAVRDIATVFGYPVSFNSATSTVYVGYAPEMISPTALADAKSHTYYFQNQAEFSLPSYGSGYCWTCSYAMLITNATGRRVTPNDVASVNLANGGSGAYCYHSQIVRAFGVKFVSALPTTSPYYAGRDSGSGGTFINNPNHDDNVVRAAIREALMYHPEGVMVRYADFPHTMVAVGFDGDIILFNDPAPTSGSSYSETGRYQAVPFYQTCMPSRGFTLSDITFIQAID